MENFTLLRNSENINKIQCFEYNSELRYLTYFIYTISGMSIRTPLISESLDIIEKFYFKKSFSEITVEFIHNWFVAETDAKNPIILYEQTDEMLNAIKEQTETTKELNDTMQSINNFYLNFRWIKPVQIRVDGKVVATKMMKPQLHWQLWYDNNGCRKNGISVRKKIF